MSPLEIDVTAYRNGKSPWDIESRARGRELERISALTGLYIEQLMARNSHMKMKKEEIFPEPRVLIVNVFRKEGGRDQYVMPVVGEGQLGKVAIAADGTIYGIDGERLGLKSLPDKDGKIYPLTGVAADKDFSIYVRDSIKIYNNQTKAYLRRHGERVPVETFVQDLNADQSSKGLKEVAKMLASQWRQVLELGKLKLWIKVLMDTGLPR